MTPFFTRSHGVLLALVGSALMFLGWSLAIVPSFRDLSSDWLVILLALVAFGAVLIPPGLDFVEHTHEPGRKRGLVPVLISALPAALLFVVAVAELPLSTAVRTLAIATELVGMVVYLYAWWSTGNVANHP